MNKRRIIVIAILALLIVLAIIGFCVSRNYFIIKKMQKNIEPYVTSTNYHRSGIRKDENGLITKFNYYVKDDKMAYFLEYDNDGEIIKRSAYRKDGKVNIYSEEAKGKTVILGIENFVGEPKIINYFANETGSEEKILFNFSRKAKIKEIEYKGKECYAIKNFGFTEDEMYMDKETGLLMKITGKEYNEETFETENEYEFDNVSDDIFIEPDVSEYTIQN